MMIAMTGYNENISYKVTYTQILHFGNYPSKNFKLTKNIGKMLQGLGFQNSIYPTVLKCQRVCLNKGN